MLWDLGGREGEMEWLLVVSERVRRKRGGRGMGGGADVCVYREL